MLLKLKEGLDGHCQSQSHPLECHLFACCVLCCPRLQGGVPAADGTAAPRGVWGQAARPAPQTGGQLTGHQRLL